MIRQKTVEWLKRNNDRITYAEIERETGLRADNLSKFVRGEYPNPTAKTIETLWKYIKTKGFDFHLAAQNEEQERVEHV